MVTTARTPTKPSASSSPTRAGIYARLSRDRNGEQTATARQIADARAMAQARDWTVADVYEDVDLSAYKGVPRPEFERLLNDVQAGAVDVILCWKMDRLVRLPREFERVWALCEAAGANVTTVKDSIDTTQPFVGKLLPRLLTIFGEMESENISVRQQSRKAADALAGRKPGGGNRPFGLTADWTAVVPDEAALIREAAQRVLAGDGLRGIARDWNARGLHTSKGLPWRPTHLRFILTAARIAGLRSHRGEIVAEAEWPAILDRSTWESVQAVLRDPARLTNRTGRGPSYLLVGFLRCSGCGHRLHSRSKRDRKRRYMCGDAADGGCGRVSTLAEPLDELVGAMVVERLSGPELAAELTRRQRQTLPPETLDQLRADQASLEQLARDYYTDRRISRSQFFAASSTLGARIADTQRRMANRNGHGVLSDALAEPGALDAAWERMTIERQREIVGALLDHIALDPSPNHGDNRWDAARIHPVWKV